MGDILKIDIGNFCLSELRRYEFVGLDVAYMFYCWFARTIGFSVRKGQVVKNVNGEIIQQTFLCSCQGFREDRGLAVENRKREPRNEQDVVVRQNVEYTLIFRLVDGIFPYLSLITIIMIFWVVLCVGYYQHIES
jgi:hypothetical protein